VKWNSSWLGATINVGSLLIVRVTLTGAGCCPSAAVTITWQGAGEAFSPAGFARNTRFAGVVPAVGLTLSQLAAGQPVTAAVKAVGSAALTATLPINGVLLPCSTLKDTVAGATARLAGLTIKVSGTDSGLDCPDVMVTMQLKVPGE
jgi:hypothetical protein